MLVKITVDGNGPYLFDPFAATAATTLEVRRATGISYAEWVAAFDAPGTPGVLRVDADAMAVIVYVARRNAGERVSFDEVASSFTYRSVTTWDVVEDEAPGETPAVI